MMEQKFIDIADRFRKEKIEISENQVKGFYLMVRHELSISLIGHMPKEPHLIEWIENMVDKFFERNVVILEQQNRELLYGTSDTKETPCGLLQ